MDRRTLGQQRQSHDLGPRCHRRDAQAHGAPLDGCLVINLDTQPEQWERCRSHLAGIGITAERFPACTPPAADLTFKDPRIKPGHVACGLSHVAALRESQRRGWKRALIIEDDAMLRSDTLRHLERATPKLWGIGWDLLYLGCHLHQCGGIVEPPKLYRAQSANHTHAYIAHVGRADRIIASIEERLAARECCFDCLPGLVKLYHRPILAVQRNGQSASHEEFIDRTHQYFACRMELEVFRFKCPDYDGQLTDDEDNDEWWASVTAKRPTHATLPA
jgi:hypothetical protein